MSYADYLKQKNKKNKITILEASKMMNKSPQFVRIAMQRGLINIGTCVKQSGKSRYDYYINPKLLQKYLNQEENSNWSFRFENNIDIINPNFNKREN